MKSSSSTKRIKIVSTGAVLAAIVLQTWALLAPMSVSLLPVSLQPVLEVTKVVLIIHGIEGAIAAILILLYRLRPNQQLADNADAMLIDHLPENTPLAVIKSGLYAFFVGTVGLLEIIKAVKPAAVESV